MPNRNKEAHSAKKGTGKYVALPITARSVIEILEDQMDTAWMPNEKMLLVAQEAPGLDTDEPMGRLQLIPPEERERISNRLVR